MFLYVLIVSHRVMCFTRRMHWKVPAIGVKNLREATHGSPSVVYTAYDIFERYSSFTPTTLFFSFLDHYLFRVDHFTVR